MSNLVHLFKFCVFPPALISWLKTWTHFTTDYIKMHECLQTTVFPVNVIVIQALEESDLRKFSDMDFGKLRRLIYPQNLTGPATRNKSIKFLMKLKFIKNSNLKRLSEHAFYLAMTCVLMPVFIYFELCIVLPTLIEPWSLAFFFHYICASFLTLNIVGNMIFGIFTNTTIRGINLEGFNQEGWSLCSVCECLKPPRAWHCDLCEICVLKRDHHCTYFTCCIGYYNHRYFMWYTFYLCVAMMYAFYFNIKYIYLFLTWNHGLTLVKFICPLASLAIDFGDESIYIFLVVINGIIGLFAGFIFIYHFNNILKGRLVPETKSYTKDFIYNKGWKLNVIEVYGTRWYLTWILPFIHSKLPGNGIEWPIEGKSKIY